MMKLLYLLKNKNNINLDITIFKFKKLPDEILFYIYKEFLEIDILYNDFIKDLKSKESCQLNIIKINKWIPLILGKKKFLKYVCENLKNEHKEMFFIKLYHDLRLKNTKPFINIQTKGESFALSLLFSLYH